MNKPLFILGEKVAVIPEAKIHHDAAAQHGKVITIWCEKKTKEYLYCVEFDNWHLGHSGDRGSCHASAFRFIKGADGGKTGQCYNIYEHELISMEPPSPITIDLEELSMGFSTED